MSKNMIFAQKLIKLWACQTCQNKKTPCRKQFLKLDVLSAIFLELWRNVIFICHSCGERKNIVGHRCSKRKREKTFFFQFWIVKKSFSPNFLIRTFSEWHFLVFLSMMIIFEHRHNRTQKLLSGNYYPLYWNVN